MTEYKLSRVRCPACQEARSKFERRLKGFDLARCSRCSFVYMNPQVEDLDQFYTNKDAEYLIQLYSRVACPSVINCYNKTLDYLETSLPNRGRLLDFACAAGYFFEQAKKRGWDAHGADVGEWAGQAAKLRGLDNLHIGRLKDLSFPSYYFDVVYAAQVFEHLPRPLEDLAEIRRILRPGGLLYLDVPNYRTLPIMIGMDDFRLNDPPQHINYFTSRSLRSLLRSAGFESVQIRSAGGLKWENLIGRPIKSDILDAHERLGVLERKSLSVTEKRRSLFNIAGWAKQVLVASIVKPLLYDRLRLGINLVGIARSPVRKSSRP